MFPARRASALDPASTPSRTMHAAQPRRRSRLASPIDKIAKVDNFHLMNRLTIEIEPEQHRQIKTLATFSGMTIKEFILTKTLGPERAVVADSTACLMGSEKNAARLRDAIATPESGHRVFESVQDLKDALGI
jgi:uncharacterized protein (DUF1778 family)